MIILAIAIAKIVYIAPLNYDSNSTNLDDTFNKLGQPKLLFINWILASRQTEATLDSQLTLHISPS